MKVIGFESKKFSFDDGKTVTGLNLFLTEARDGVTGTACERVFMSDAKIGDYSPVLGDDVEISYNRFGKAQRITKL